MSLFRFKKIDVGEIQGPFSHSYCLHPAISELASKRNLKFIPFDNKRDFQNIHLLYPAWSARELSINSKVKSNMSKLWVYETYRDNFITCLSNGDICFVLGFAPVEGRNALELSLASGKPLKRLWNHKFADVISTYISFLLNAFPKHFLLASCDAEAPVYSNFAEHFNFIFWEAYQAYGRQYLLHIFNSI